MKPGTKEKAFSTLKRCYNGYFIYSRLKDLDPATTSEPQGYDGCKCTGIKRSNVSRIGHQLDSRAGAKRANLLAWQAACHAQLKLGVPGYQLWPNVLNKPFEGIDVRRIAEVAYEEQLIADRRGR